jgi:hypothetical protein
VQADSADHAGAFDDSDALAELRRLHGGALTCRAASKDEEVVVERHGEDDTLAT